VVIVANDRWPELTAGMDYLGFSRQAAGSGEPVAAEALASIESVLGGQKQEASFEYPCHTPTQEGWYLMEVTRPPPHVGGAIITHTEITGRKQAEDRLRRATGELARSNRDLEQFAYVASHDLQEPLRMVNGFLKLLAERCAGQLDEKSHEYIAYSLQGAQRMSQLITDLLDFSRVDRKGKELQPTDANEQLGDALANLRASIAEAGARVTHEELPTVRADASQLGQLLQNLIGNAVKFRDPDRPCQVHVAARKDGGQWVFSVRDNGIGIDPKQHDRVFVIFQRLHTRQEYPGTGIGLAICQRIVERHGGRIWVESQPDEGSTFFFTMPRDKAE
jgi:light-regulated signal transduction histidine kinase (bacteriophytochrome)